MIAVVANHTLETISWLRETYASLIQSVNMGSKRVILTNGKIFQIVTNAQEANGHEFSDYMIAPDYVNLLDLVKTKVKK